ncbi:hypothetical protein [Arthrobacter sp. 260]|uniref:hypothetical protein n=1 Tax=Arthrobacter sp. 260 TaxID=2735314 RepID=UPI0014910487|nr:hypothetical protein [Arthrobacter sp. 260]NOJ60602.1 hypothetical protein [Arthrobacter sp. 260]
MSVDQDEQKRREDRLAMTRIVLRPTGTPLPLAFMGLAVATIGVSALQLGIVPAREEQIIALGILVLTVPLQLFSSVIGFGARDPIAGTGMAMVAGTWALIAVAMLVTPDGASLSALGVLLITAALAMLAPILGAKGKLVAAAVLAGSALRFAITGVAHLTGSDGWETAAGIFGFALGALAIYAAIGFETEEAGGPFHLPLLRRGSGTKPLADDMGEQVEGIAREAGVRRQL